MPRILLLLISCCVVLCTTAARYYEPDVLGDGYESHTFVMPDDYHGAVVSTLVRKLAPDTSHCAVLYVHGYNDYFFQTEMAERFNNEGVNFYAIDLRKYGRSLREGQYEYEVRDMSEYYADIDSAMSVIKREGNERIILMGHSTGGLTTSLYCHAHRDSLPVDVLVLNSPFFEWNFGAVLRNFVIPTVAMLGKLFPDWGLPDAKIISSYAMSLLSEYYGEWTYNTEWKKLKGRGERFGWIRAIDEGHKIVHNEMNLHCPILLMRSDKSVQGTEWTPDFMCADAVLSVDDISHYGTRIGDDVTEVVIKDGLHDLALSRKDVRENFYNQLFEWLRNRHIIADENQ